MTSADVAPGSVLVPRQVCTSRPWFVHVPFVCPCATALCRLPLGCGCALWFVRVALVCAGRPWFVHVPFGLYSVFGLNAVSVCRI